MSVFSCKVAAQLLGFIRFYNPGRGVQALRKRLNFRGSCKFEDRSKGRKRLLLVIAGHKPCWWPMVLPRLQRFAPSDADVCIAAPGVNPQYLRAFCETHGWSYLTTRANRLALASNLAIRLHPSARMILKTDEDMFFAEGFFEGLEKTMEAVREKDVFRPGFVAPLINVNGFSYRILLEKLGRLDEYKQRFGEARHSCTDNAAWGDPLAAEYLWELCKPFDAVAARFREEVAAHSICPHRFNIGCILFERELWDAMQGFTVTGDGFLGVEESDWCAWCFDQSRVIAVSHNVLVGHGGFSAQMERVRSVLEAREDLRERGGGKC